MNAINQKERKIKVNEILSNNKLIEEKRKIDISFMICYSKMKARDVDGMWFVGGSFLLKLTLIADHL